MPKAGQAKEKPQTLGYPTLEKLIEVQDPKAHTFSKTREKLNALAHKSSDPDEKAKARQAVLAYDRFLHFFDEMIHLRDKLYQEKVEEAKRTQNTKKKAKK